MRFIYESNGKNENIPVQRIDRLTIRRVAQAAHIGLRREKKV